MEYTIDFLKVFMIGLIMAAPILAFLTLMILSLGLFVGKRECWTRGNSIYWAFITATTVGYGDLIPSKPLHRILAIVICLTGLIATGIIVSTAVYAAGEALKKHVTPLEIEHIKEYIQVDELSP